MTRYGHALRVFGDFSLIACSSSADDRNGSGSVSCAWDIGPWKSGQCIQKQGEGASDSDCDGKDDTENLTNGKNTAAKWMEDGDSPAQF